MNEKFAHFLSERMKALLNHMLKSSSMSESQCSKFYFFDIFLKRSQNYHKKIIKIHLKSFWAF